MTEKIVSSSRPSLKKLNFRKYRLVLRETSAGKTRLFFTNNGSSCFFETRNFFLHLSFADFLKTWPSLSLGKGNASLKVILPSSSVSECLLEAHTSLSRTTQSAIICTIELGCNHYSDASNPAVKGKQGFHPGARSGLKNIFFLEFPSLVKRINIIENGRQNQSFSQCLRASSKACFFL